VLNEDRNSWNKQKRPNFLMIVLGQRPNACESNMPGPAIPNEGMSNGQGKRKEIYYTAWIISSKVKRKTRLSILSALIQHILGIPRQSSETGRRNKRNTN
jgi:hypothetical protein